MGISWAAQPLSVEHPDFYSTRLLLPELDAKLLNNYPSHSVVSLFSLFGFPSSIILVVWVLVLLVVWVLVVWVPCSHNSRPGPRAAGHAQFQVDARLRLGPPRVSFTTWTGVACRARWATTRSGIPTLPPGRHGGLKVC